MKTDNVSIEPTRRFPKSEFEKILRRVPITITGDRDLQLRAFIGLGRVIYLEPTHGVIDAIEFGKNVTASRYSAKYIIGSQDHTEKSSLSVRYKGQSYKIYLDYD
jgi:hypothetical protein